jgi:O-methyltransferase involved in polyketide biosynthesis
MEGILVFLPENQTYTLFVFTQTKLHHPRDSLFVADEPDWNRPPNQSSRKEIRHEKHAHSSAEREKVLYEEKHKNSTGAVLGSAWHGHRGTGCPGQ